MRFGILLYAVLQAVILPEVTFGEDKPDVVLIISDDQAWDDYSFMQHSAIKTPHLDQLARESILYTRGYVPDSLCRPSLATIISGRYPHEHGIVGNDPPPAELEELVAGSARRGRKYRDPGYQKQIAKFQQLHSEPMVTLAERLKAVGYTSLQTGKWWEGDPKNHGFDFAMTHGDVNRGGRHGDEGLDVGRKTMEPIIDFIKQSKEESKPYLLWYAPFLPHTPHNPPERLLKKYAPLTESKSIAKYWAMCEWFDETVGELRNIIKKEGRPDNTIIIYVCDNGWITRSDRSAYAPRSKRSRYDGGIRTPIMVHWPGKVKPRRDETNLASSIDIVPTVLAQLNLPADGLPGIDLTDNAAVSERKAIFGEILEHDIQSMTDPAESLRYRWIIEGEMKLIVPYTTRMSGEKAELFNLINDPYEETDLSAKNSATVEQLSTKLDSWWNPGE